MEHFVNIEPQKLDQSVFKLIGEDWALITIAGEDGSYNPMTVSWGGLGVLWGKNVCFAFIRPQRYTYEFAERENATWTFSFFPEKYHDALGFCGKNSGRDVDKVKACNLTPENLAHGGIGYKEANLIIEAKKLYSDDIRESRFFDRSLLRHYAKSDYHRMYICEICDIYRKEEL